MEKQCLVIMPTNEPDGYAQGHFNRVYEYVIVPACRLAGFWPDRADNPNTSNSASEIIKNIIESEIAICDLSSNNSSVLYAFAIRQALNLPVTLIRDAKTKLTFYSKEFAEVEYDDSLRIDTVQKATEILSEALKTSFSNKGEKNTLFTRLGIDLNKKQSAPIEPVFTPEPLVEPPEPKEKPLPIISPLPEYVGDPITELQIEKLKVGDFLFHMNHGKGEIKTIKKMGKDKIAELLFESGAKTLVIGTSGFFRKVNG